MNGAGLLVFDSLMDGTSVGEVGGGKFVSQGWQVTSKSDFIRYAVPTLLSGFVEWETTGLRTTNPEPEGVMLFGMWDASPEAGPYRTNAYRVHLRKLDDTGEPPFLRLRFIANGEQHDTGANISFWDPGRVYRWRIEWGPSSLGNTVQVFVQRCSTHDRAVHPRLRTREPPDRARRRGAPGIHRRRRLRKRPYRSWTFRSTLRAKEMSQLEHFRCTCRFRFRNSGRPLPDGSFGFRMTAVEGLLPRMTLKEC